MLAEIGAKEKVMLVAVEAIETAVEAKEKAVEEEGSRVN